MSNKFLGLDSINVLKEYIDNQFELYDSTSRLMTIQAYKYITDGNPVTTPIGGSYDTTGANIIYPAGWSSLKLVVDNLGESLETALSNGSIYMSAATIEGSNTVIWSNPVKISGQNGVSVRFKFTYSNESLTNDQIELLSNNPSGVNATNRFEYVYTKTANENWQGPSLWATYAKNATNTVWRYCVTETDANPQRPADGDLLWTSTIPTTNLSAQRPYMWMCYQLVPANDDGTYSALSNESWSEPILFGHYGQDGAVPDYTYILYCEGNDNPEFPELPGIIKPDQPIFVEGALITDYINEQWVELPGVEDTIWWQCAFKVDGRTNKVLEIGAVKRYNGVDGIALPGPFTKHIYAWSANQSAPTVSDTLINGWLPENWSELPNQPEQMNLPEASLWMMTGNANGISPEGYPQINAWSNPVKLTGPRGPIAYDYRLELRYCEGTSTTPKTSGTWRDDPQRVTTTSLYPYVWIKPYLVYYKMQYGETPNADGSFPVVQINNTPDGIIKEFGSYRASGLNGDNGNTKNNLKYNSTESTVTIDEFKSYNLFINNTTTDTVYNINYNQIDFETGYTGKFSNIGSGTVTINTTDSYVFVGSGKTASDEIRSLQLLPQESVEIICNTVDTSKEFIVIGKSLITPTDTPTE